MSQKHITPANTQHRTDDSSKVTEKANSGESVEAVEDAVPVPEQGSHARSHAAHPDLQGKADTRPAGNLRQGAAPGALREPPQRISRAGKQHKGQ